MTELHPRVAQALQEGDVAYTIRRHADQPVAISSPHDFARALGYDVVRITKTLFLKSHDGAAMAVLVCSADRRADFRAIGKAVGSSRMEIASKEDLAKYTGYPRNGVTPLGLDKSIVVLLDSGLEDQETVLVGGGDIGIEVELAPVDLQRISDARFGTFAK